MRDLKKLTLIVLLITDSIALSEKGAGVSDQQEVTIKSIARSCTETYRPNLLTIAQSLEDKLYSIDYQPQRYWSVQVFMGSDVISGRAGIKTHNDTWIYFHFQDFNAYYWIWRPVRANSLIHALSNVFIENNLQSKGEGISQNQEALIINFMRNAELSKGGDILANAVLVKEKLEDSFGQEWIVQIFGGNNLKFGRQGMSILSNQWLTLPYQGDHHWSYLIWVAQYW